MLISNSHDHFISEIMQQSFWQSFVIKSQDYGCDHRCIWLLNVNFCYLFECHTKVGWYEYLVKVLSLQKVNLIRKLSTWDHLFVIILKNGNYLNKIEYCIILLIIILTLSELKYVSSGKNDNVNISSMIQLLSVFIFE